MKYEWSGFSALRTVYIYTLYTLPSYILSGPKVTCTGGPVAGLNYCETCQVWMAAFHLAAQHYIVMAYMA